MKRRWLKFLLCVGVIALLFLGISAWTSAGSEKAYQHELDLARQEGIPTNAAEFAATIPKASPGENAALTYLKITALNPPDAGGEEASLLFEKQTPAEVAKAKSLLASNQHILQLIDQALTYPKCWFERDWTDGPAVVLSEYRTFRICAGLLRLRAQVAYLSGDKGAAVNDIRNSFRIAQHAANDGISASAISAQSIGQQALRELCAWCYRDPTDKELQATVLTLVEQLPRPNVRNEERGNLFEYLTYLNLSETEVGRRKLGFKVDDISPEKRLEIGALHTVMNRPLAKVQFAKAARQYVEAMSLPPAQRGPAVHKAVENENHALMAYPYLYLSDLSDPAQEAEIYSTREQKADAMKAAFRAFIAWLAPGHPVNRQTQISLSNGFVDVDVLQNGQPDASLLIRMGPSSPSKAVPAFGLPAKIR